MENTRKTLLCAFVVLTMCVQGVVTAGATYSFENISNAIEANAQAGESQFLVEVMDIGGGQVEFLFTNSGPAEASIIDIFFDNGDLGTLSGTMGFTDIVGDVTYSQNSNWGELPSADLVGFVTTDGLLAESTGDRVVRSGVNNDEQLGITLSGDYSQVLSELDNGDLRIGIYTRYLGFGPQGRESFVTVFEEQQTEPVITTLVGTHGIPEVAAVPAPSSVLLATLGFGVLRALRKRKV